MPIPRPITQYNTPALLPGIRTDFTIPLILELFDKGQGGDVIRLLYIADLKVEEKGKKFKITTRKLNGKSKEN